MVMLLIGLAMIICVIIAVKLFDDEIRQKHWRKVVINLLTIFGLIFLIIGIIQVISKI